MLARVICFAVAGFYFTGFVGALLRLRRKTGRVTRNDLRVSVLKPMCGLDPRIEANLDSFAHLDAHPDFEVILCIADARDPAVRVAARYVATYPARFRLVLGADASLNPKVALLAHGARRARNPLLWISDSNTVTTQAHLEGLVATYLARKEKRNVPTLVHAPLVAVGGSGLGAALERAHLVSFANVHHENTRMFGIHTVIGKSLLTSVDDLEATGGFAAVRDFLAEDYMMGVAFTARGGQVKRMAIPTRNVLGALSLKAWMARHQRWAVLRKTIVPLPYCSVELLTYPVIALSLPVLALKAIGDLILYRAYSGEKLRPIDLLATFLKEPLMLYVWFSALLTNHVQWRGRAIGLGFKSAIRHTDAPASRLQRHWRRAQRVRYTLSHAPARIRAALRRAA